ncbi:holin [Acinetobacter indicus]|uniref:holin n=1 Tax=Acinetobacter indicus TaxID=756892 RepID=UPI000CEBF5A0|nr:holin [Acinetobacter indicus]
MSDQKTAAMEMAATVSSAASKTTYAGAGTGFFAWLLSIDVLPLLGFLLALAGFIVNLVFKYLENKRAQELHDLKKKEYMNEVH